jgi:hypothetical protein
MVSIRGIMERSLFINDVNTRFLSSNFDVLDVVGRPAHLFQLFMKDHGAFSCSLRVESKVSKRKHATYSAGKEILNRMFSMM